VKNREATGLHNKKRRMREGLFARGDPEQESKKYGGKSSASRRKHHHIDEESLGDLVKEIGRRRKVKTTRGKRTARRASGRVPKIDLTWPQNSKRSPNVANKKTAKDWQNRTPSRQLSRTCLGGLKCTEKARGQKREEKPHSPLKKKVRPGGACR